VYATLEGSAVEGFDVGSQEEELPMSSPWRVSSKSNGGSGAGGGSGG